MNDFDIVINGGGITGLAFALLLDRTAAHRSIAIIEPRPPAGEQDEVSLRVSAIAPSSRAVLESCGVWAKLPEARIAAYRRMCVWRGDNAQTTAQRLNFDAAEQGAAELGYILENELLRAVLWQAAAASPDITLFGDVAPHSLTATDDRMMLTLAGGAQCSARLLVGADGARSWVREQLGVVTREQRCEQQGIVAHVRSERSHADTAWQRFLPGGPLALLPLADGRSSVVWSCPDAEVDAIMTLDDQAFSAVLTETSGGVLGALSVTTERAAFPLVAAHTRDYSGPRFALIGDAAHRVHPLAGQGVNLGLLDAAALAETLVTQAGAGFADPGDARVLRRFERWRKGDNLLTLTALQAIHFLFTSRYPRIPALAGAGLGWMNELAPVKRRLADYAMGRVAGLPAAARVEL